MAATKTGGAPRAEPLRFSTGRQGRQWTRLPPCLQRSLAADLIDVVAEKTGYPADVLDLDMQLDADLGIDSIKRVEILSALQDRLPGLPALKPDNWARSATSERSPTHLSRAGVGAGEFCSGRNHCDQEVQVPTRRC